MVDVAHFEQLNQSFAALLGDLSPMWPEEDMRYIRDEVDHREYADALENLIAIGLKNGWRFPPAQLQKIEAMAASMGLEHASFLLDLRKTARGSDERHV